MNRIAIFTIVLLLAPGLASAQVFPPKADTANPTNVTLTVPGAKAKQFVREVVRDVEREQGVTYTSEVTVSGGTCVRTPIDGDAVDGKFSRYAGKMLYTMDDGTGYRALGVLSGRTISLCVGNGTGPEQKAALHYLATILMQADNP